MEECERSLVRAEGDWQYDAETLTAFRHKANEHAAATLLNAGSDLCERRQKECARPLSTAEELQLIIYHAQKLPELARLCNAPAEVTWTATVFFRRFFLLRSPMEFDPLLMMFTALHVACKVEEVHEITLDALLERSTMGAQGGAKSKITSLELPLLEAINFNLFTEPKPQASLEMLTEDIYGLSSSGRSSITVSSEAWKEASSHAEELIMRLAVSTDAILQWPVAAIVLAALWASLEGADLVQRGCLPDFMDQLLSSHFESGQQRAASSRIIEEVLHQIDSLSDVQIWTEEGIENLTQAARSCQKTFDVLRMEAAQRSEAKRQERKRRWSEMKASDRGRQRRLMELQMRIATPARSAHCRTSMVGIEDDFALSRVDEDDD
mmetsp:Transcript_20044/g.36205  ORF Transcript_20044/g.36205 Transcript_20044/m.36205 type:complete len:381 (+) Transcript_20044:46-1188(+)